MGKLAQIKTKPTSASVEEFIGTIADEQKRKDCHVIIRMMKKATKQEPQMWGSAIIGFGNVRYKSPGTNREVEWFQLGFSPRKANLTLYLVSGIKHLAEQLEQLGKHKVGGGCLYINKLADVDLTILQKIINEAATKKTQ